MSSLVFYCTTVTIGEVGLLVVEPRAVGSITVTIGEQYFKKVSLSVALYCDIFYVLMHVLHEWMML